MALYSHIQFRLRCCGQESLWSTCWLGPFHLLSRPGGLQSACDYCPATRSKWFSFSSLPIPAFSLGLVLPALKAVFLGHPWEVPLLATNLLVSPGSPWLVVTSSFLLSAISVCLTVHVIGLRAQGFSRIITFP